ncbi:hypothetical protein HDU93_006884 [Gonapodya sp. JEL0774]|nr:hypothetical protein HDU93_006884 [Gonapodya sp. JEL0774]
MPDAFLITGATGLQGGSTARLLLSAGQIVYAFVRDPLSPEAKLLQALGAVLVRGSFDDPSSITSAFSLASHPVTGVFLNTYPSFTTPTFEIDTAKAFVSAALASGTVKNFVVSTVYNANIAVPDPSTYPFLAAYYRSKSGVEEVIRDAGFASYTILRPCWLNHNYLLPGASYHFPAWRSRQITVSYPTNYRQPHLDALDVGKFAAPALQGLAVYQNKEIDLVGEYLTWSDVAEKLGKAAETVVKVHYRSEKETNDLLTSGTLPTIQSQVWASKNKREEVDVKALEREFGVTVMTLDEWLVGAKEKLKIGFGVEA